MPYRTRSGISITKNGSPCSYDLKMILNYGYDSVNCFTLILCGESHLNATLSRPMHEALRQRITVHYNYQGLSDEESVAYIIHKLERAGSSKAVIDDSALRAVAGHAHGNPRLIDNIMSDAVAIGAQTSKKTIDTEVILAAVTIRTWGRLIFCQCTKAMGCGS